MDKRSVCACVRKEAREERKKGSASTGRAPLITNSGVLLTLQNIQITTLSHDVIYPAHTGKNTYRAYPKNIITSCTDTRLHLYNAKITQEV